MRIIIIAAVAPNRIIGNKGALPWSYPEDLKKFRELTTGQGKYLIMGRKTFESIPLSKATGERLPGRRIVVLSRRFQPAENNAIFMGDLNQALDFLGSVQGAKEVYICGGSSIYKEVLETKQVTDMMLTEVSVPYKGDVYFPKYSKDEWKEIERIPLNKECDLVHYQFDGK